MKDIMIVLVLYKIRNAQLNLNIENLKLLTIVNKIKEQVKEKIDASPKSLYLQINYN
jgi:hypothetical protein